MCACISCMEEFGRDCCNRGYHVLRYTYKEIWWAPIGEELESDRELENSCDRYTVRSCEKEWGGHWAFVTKAIESLFAVFRVWRCDIVQGNWA